MMMKMKRLTTIFKDLAGFGKLAFSEKYSAYYIHCERIIFAYTNASLDITEDIVFQKDKVLESFQNVNWELGLGVAIFPIRNGKPITENNEVNIKNFSIVALTGKHNGSFENIFVARQMVGKIDGYQKNGHNFTLARDSIKNLYDIVMNYHQKYPVIKNFNEKFQCTSNFYF
jgi:hypothetical protein